MSKLFTLTIIPKVIVGGKVVIPKKQGGQSQVLRVEASFNDSDIDGLVRQYLLSSVAVPEKDPEIVFEKIYIEKDSLVGHIYVLYKIEGYDLQEIDSARFDFVDEQKFEYGKK